jgi:hypothetical protein
MSFDAQRLRDNLEEWLIEHYQREVFEDAAQRGALVGVGDGIMLCAIQCFLVGLFDQGFELAKKAHTFLHASIENGEDPCPLGKDAQYNNLALATWLVENRIAMNSLKAAVSWRENWLDENPDCWTREVQLVLPDYLDAQEYELLIARYERSGLKKPANLQRVQGEGTMSYAIARQRLGLEYSQAEIDAALNTFFKRHVPSWLGEEGRYDDAVRWMQRAFWKPGDDPIATLLRCYDYLPGLERPKYP